MARSNDTDGCGTAFILLVVVYAIVQFIKKNYITICIVLGIIALIILLAMTYSRKKKAESLLSSKSEQTSNPPQKRQPSEAQINYVNELLERARHLADIINTTMDREKFYISFDELNSVLKCLSQFEDRISFSGTLPSAILERINAQKQASIDSLERRIKEAECPEQIDPDIVSGNQSEVVVSQKQDISNACILESQSKEFPCQEQISSDNLHEPIQKKCMEVDFYFKESGFFTIDKERASIGMLQRNFGIGFNRAAAIMDQLCDAGVVRPEEGTNPRKVLMSMEQFKEFIDSTELIESASVNIVPSVSENDSPIDRRIQMYNGKYDYMDGHDFEYFCADLLRRNGFCNVKVTQESNDQGVDIVAEKDGILYGIQCKRYSSDVGNKAVQEVFSGLAFYHCHVGVVLTNQHFTKSAIELAQVNRVLLWDREKLEILIKNAQ